MRSSGTAWWAHVGGFLTGTARRRSMRVRTPIRSRLGSRTRKAAGLKSDATGADGLHAGRMAAPTTRVEGGDSQMALKSFGRGGGEDDLGARPAMPSTAPGGLTAFIDQGSEFEGKLSFRDTVRIDGRFRGEIASENTLIVGESGEIEAKIRSRTVAVSGAVGATCPPREGGGAQDRAHDGQHRLTESARREGAVINGTIHM